MSSSVEMIAVTLALIRDVTVVLEKKLAARRLIEGLHRCLDAVRPRHLERGHSSQFQNDGDAFRSLTRQDKETIANFMACAERAGYDTLAIHLTDAAGSPDFLDFVTAHRAGEPWSSWGFARDGDTICAWSTTTCEDLGQFATLREAFEHVLIDVG